MANSLPQSVDKHDREGRELLAAARIGSVEALGTLFESMRGHLRLAAMRELPRSIRGAVSASDLVQEAMATAHASFQSFRGASPAEFFGWMRTILARAAIDRLRYEKAARRDPGFPKVAIDMVGSNHGAMADEIHERPESVAIRGEDARLVEEALATLPADLRRVLWLRHWEGKSFDAIATDLGRSEMAIRKAWCRGLERLERAICDRAAPYPRPGSGE
jgi:RNA polymerase sigma-70 factor (ECF subfamily)